MADIKKEIDRVKNQAVDTFNNANVTTRNRVIGVVVVVVIVFVAYLFFRG